MRKHFAVYFVLALAGCCFADDKTPDFVRNLTQAPDDSLLAPIDHATASLSGVASAGQLVRAIFRQANEPIPAKGFSCIINIVKWAADSDGKLTPKSNWYVYNPQATWTDADFLTNKRLYGISRPYILIVHLGVTDPGSEGDPNSFKLAYTYNAVHRLPANIQNLKDAISLFAPPPAAPGAAMNTRPPDYWALGTLAGDPPSDITITGAVTQSGTTVHVDTTAPKFDNEGLYRWDISVGVPITSYKQIQDVTTTGGTATVAAVDKRNMFVLGNLFLKPVDVKSSTFLAVPHLVGGVSIASQPLHSAVAALGWGPAFANFYIGALILTNDLPNHTTDHHYKLAFGLNIPLRSVASKLGLKSQVE